MTNNLPPLPVPYGKGFTNEQMRNYARAALAQAQSDVPAGWVSAQSRAYIAICEMLESTGFGLLSRNPNEDQLDATVDTLRALLASTPAHPAQQIESQTAVPAERDVTSILLDIQPGFDGMGVEVYAKTVRDVEDRLTEMGQELEEWQLGIRLHPTAVASQPVERKPIAAAASDVLAERQRQISAELWTPEHDDEHRDCELAAAAATYATCDAKNHLNLKCIGVQVWPGRWSFNDQGYRRNLVKAGALIIAEIERIDRLAKVTSQKGGAA